jgi:hypothetical protein
MRVAEVLLGYDIESKNTVNFNFLLLRYISYFFFLQKQIIKSLFQHAFSTESINGDCSAKVRILEKS